MDSIGLPLPSLDPAPAAGALPMGERVAPRLSSRVETLGPRLRVSWFGRSASSPDPAC